MAGEEIGHEMVRQGEVAMGAFEDVAANGAELLAPISPSIEKKECLLADFEPIEGGFRNA